MTDPSPPQTDDPIGVTLASIGAGATMGGFLITLGTMTARFLQSDTGTEPDPMIATILAITVLLGLAAAVAVAFSSSREIANLWRRSVTGAIALFGAAIIAIVAIPLELFLGAGAHAGLAVLLLIAHVACRRFLQAPPIDQ